MIRKLVDKLIDECTETVEEVKLAKITLVKSENGNKYCIDDRNFYNFYRNYHLFCLLQLVFD